MAHIGKASQKSTATAPNRTVWAYIKSIKTILYQYQYCIEL